jgi:opacity protein-like surface antigen
MTNRVTRLGGLAALVLAVASTASADIKLNDNFSISGYAAASYEYTKWKGQDSTDSLFNGQKDTPSADAVKTAFTASFKPVTGVISLYYVPNLPTNELTVLDAYVTYDAGGGLTVTGGKFLSWMGYEAFDTVNMAQITYGAPTVGGLAPIPAYHTGVKVEYGDNDFSSGVALVDSVYGPTFSRGDGELKHNAGFEAYVTYKAIKDFTFFGGLVYDTAGEHQKHSVVMVDLWAQYQLTKQLVIAGEITDKDAGDSAKGWDWLVYLNYSFTDKASIVGRISGENPNSNTKLAGLAEYQQYTVGPSYKVTDNLTVRAEYSYYDYKAHDAYPSTTKNFFGVQGVFKF